jgi:multiple sugar transport system permease protein
VKILRALVIVLGFLAAALPLLWMGITSIKPRDATISQHPKWIPAPAAPDSPTSPFFAMTTEPLRGLNQVHAGAQHTFLEHLTNSAIIGVLSTIASVLLGTCCAYGFSRFSFRGSKDWLFFILSTRFMPPLAVVVPVLLMYRELDLQGTHAGLVILYTVFNLSLSVWLMKGFLDEIPRAYEEAALVDGWSRAQAFVRVVLPEARTGMAVTAVFCLISAWNEYGFAMTLNSSGAVTVPAYFAGLQGNIEGMPWPQVAAGALVFVAPIVAFTVRVRSHLLRGMTFGTIKQ